LVTAKWTRYDYNLTIMKSPKLATDNWFKKEIKSYLWNRTMLNLCGIYKIVLFQRHLIYGYIMMSRIDSWHRKISTGRHFQNGRHNTAKIQHCRIAHLMVTYHSVKFYVSIIIQLEVININVRNFKFPKGFYSNPNQNGCQNTA
jgi:hypothetical protein